MNEVKSIKIYSRSQITVATLFAGPLAGAYMMSRNFKALGNDKGAKNAIWIGLGSLVLILLFVFLSNIPESVSKSFPLYWAAIVYACARKYQPESKDEVVKNTNRTISFWKVLAIVLLSLLISFLFAIILFAVVR